MFKLQVKELIDVGKKQKLRKRVFENDFDSRQQVRQFIRHRRYGVFPVWKEIVIIHPDGTKEIVPNNDKSQ